MSRTRHGVATKLAAMLCTVVLSACASTPSSSPQSPKPTSQPAVEASAPPATTAPSNPEVTETPAPPTPAPSGQAVTRVSIFLVALEDAGKSGKRIGCDDSVVAVEQEVDPAPEPVAAALQALFAIRDRNYGESGLYNALYQSQLTVDSVSVTEGRATVQLRGQTMLNGVCDNPRAEAQIEETVLAAAGVNEAVVLINGTPLTEHFSLKG